MPKPKHKQIHLDLKVARRQAGLTQADLAHLLAVSSSYVSQVEAGKSLPSLRVMANLSLIYGKPLESLLSEIMDGAASNLIKRLRTLPSAKQGQPEFFNRTYTLSQLAIRLEALTSIRDGGA